MPEVQPQKPCHGSSEWNYAKSGVHQPEQESSEGDTYYKTSFRSASTVSIRGRPSAPTVGPQVPSREERQQPTNVPLSQRPTTGWFKQNIMNGVPGGNLCRSEVNAITEREGMGAQQVATRTLHSCSLKRWLKDYR